MGLTKPRAAQIFNLDYKQSTRAVATTNVTLTGGAPTPVDGVNLSVGDRVLVTAQSTGSQNGLYQVQTVGSGANGTWIRTSDGNETGEIEAGMIVMVTEGTVYADTQWKLVTDDPITIGTTALTFTQNYMANSISSGTSNVVVNSNANVTVSSAGTANVLTVSNTGAFVSGVTSVSGNVTGGNLRTAGLITATGNITGGNIRTAGVVSATGDMFGKELWSTQSSGDEGGQVNLGIPAANTALTGQVTIDVYQNQLRFFQGNSARGAYIDLTAAAVGVGSNLLAGGGGTPGGANTNVQFNDGGVFGGTAGLTFNKTTNAVATTGTFSATGNVAGGNILTGGLISATGNVTGGNLIAGTGASGNITGANVITANTVTTTANITGGNILTSGLVSATGAITGAAITGTSLTVSTGNITGGNLLLSGAIIDSAQLDIQTSAANANIALAPNGTGMVTVSTQVSATGNVTGGNIRTAGLVSATGAITGAAITGTSLTVSTGNITAGNLLLSGAIIDSAQLDIQTSAANANIALAPNGTGVVTVSTQVSAVGNVTGGNIRTAGLISATGAITGAALTGTSLTVSTGNVSCGNIVNTNANGVGNIGSSATRFNQVFALASSAQYADLAEKYTADADYAPGTVLEFGGDQEVTATTTSHSPRVAGIVSTQPSYIMNDGLVSDHTAMVSLTGRVPCLVQGPIAKGDRLVASDVVGHAQRLDPAQYEPGCIIGKALEDYPSTATGTIEVAVGRF